MSPFSPVVELLTTLPVSFVAVTCKSGFSPVSAETCLLLKCITTLGTFFFKLKVHILVVPPVKTMLLLKTHLLPFSALISSVTVTSICFCCCRALFPTYILSV